MDTWAPVVQRINAAARLSPAELDRLWMLCKAGSEEARNRLVEANLKLVLLRAGRFSNHGTFEENFQAGTLGLLRAVEKFDPGRKFKFSTYAVFWIDQAIHRGRTDAASVIRVPPHARENGRTFMVEQARLRAALGREPEEEEVADALDMSPRQLAGVRDALQGNQVASLDKPVGEGDDGETMDLAGVLREPAPTIGQEHLLGDALAVLEGMEGREVGILRMRLGIGETRALTLEEVADRLELSRERVRQLEEKAVGEFRKALLRRGIIRSIPENGPRRHHAAPRRAQGEVNGMSGDLKAVLDQLEAKRAIYDRAIEGIKLLMDSGEDIPAGLAGPRTSDLPEPCSICGVEKKRMKPCEKCGKKTCRKCKVAGVCTSCDKGGTEE